MDKRPSNRDSGRMAVAFASLSLLTLIVLALTARFVTLPEVRGLVFRSAAGLEETVAALPSPVPTVRVLPEIQPAPSEPVRGGGESGLGSEPGDLPERQQPPEPEREPVDAVLSIPRLKVEQAITKIYVRDGYWDVAPLENQVGWLETTGGFPGDERAMVFIAHVTLEPDAAPGPFYKLYDLDPGDEITYQVGSTRYVYEMEDRAVVDPKDVEALYQPDGDQIILVTCTAWDYLTFDYGKRLLIHARLVRTETVPTDLPRNDQT